MIQVFRDLDDLLNVSGAKITA